MHNVAKDKKARNRILMRERRRHDEPVFESELEGESKGGVR